MEKEKKFLQSYDPGSTLIFMTSYPFFKILFFFLTTKVLIPRIIVLWVGLQTYEDYRITSSKMVATSYMQLFKLNLN